MSLTIDEKRKRIDKVAAAIAEAMVELEQLPLRRAHYVNICVRINGEDRYFEADWMPRLQAALRFVLGEGIEG